MTTRQMFIEAHRMARADRAFEATAYTGGARAYAYYFRLALICLQQERTLARNPAALVRGFQIIEPARVWA